MTDFFLHLIGAVIAFFSSVVLQAHYTSTLYIKFNRYAREDHIYGIRAFACIPLPAILCYNAGIFLFNVNFISFVCIYMFWYTLYSWLYQFLFDHRSLRYWDKYYPGLSAYFYAHKKSNKMHFMVGVPGYLFTLTAFIVASIINHDFYQWKWMYQASLYYILVYFLVWEVSRYLRKLIGKVNKPFLEELKDALFDTAYSSTMAVWLPIFYWSIYI